MFSAGTDSAFTSSLLFFVSCILSLLLWRYGWPGGPQVMLLTAVLLVMCQYGERMSPKGFAIGFSIGTLFAFPIFIFLLPSLHNANAFWLSMLLIYFPVAFVMNGQYKVRALPFIAFAVAVMVNANSHNYVPGNDYFNGYTTFLFALVAVITISSGALSLLVVNDTETRLKAQIDGWAKERQRFLNHRSQERSKILVRLERRTDIILSMYSKLDPAQQGFGVKGIGDTADADAHPALGVSRNARRIGERLIPAGLRRPRRPAQRGAAECAFSRRRRAKERVLPLMPRFGLKKRENTVG
ncbi:FUSC family protein [Edwardsiella anguillarum]|nr:FUSC family protein [Edwardsiella anguillarum]